MIDTIKSIYFIKKLFSHLDETKTLKLIVYNKNLQNILDINLINYKGISGKYKLGEKNGGGKEFYISNNQLAYEGGYKNGKRNGKGKEYNKKGELIYEGEYKNGKRDGKGKEYWRKYEYLYSFEGQYLNGNKWNGKEYYLDYDKEERVKINEIKDGEGHIKEYYEYRMGTYIIKGEIKNGKLNGKGLEGCYYYCLDCGYTLIFEGVYKNGKKWDSDDTSLGYKLKNGKGYAEEINEDYIYKGEYLNGEKNGKGKEYYFNQLVFEGEYKNGKRNGKGKEYNEDKILIYEGEYKNGYKSKGKEYYNNGKLYFEGDYISGEKWNGKGYDESGKIIFEIKNGNGYIKEYNNNDYYEGDYLNGEKCGKGKEYDKDGKLIFEGEYKNGKRNGRGKEYNKDGKLIYEGEYKYGKRWIRYGIEYNKKGELIYEGEYLDGKRWNGKGKEYDKYYHDILIFIYEGEYKNGIKWNGVEKIFLGNDLINSINYLNGIGSIDKDEEKEIILSSLLENEEIEIEDEIDDINTKKGYNKVHVIKGTNKKGKRKIIIEDPVMDELYVINSLNI